MKKNSQKIFFLILFFWTINRTKSSVICYDSSFTPVYLEVQIKSCKYTKSLGQFIQKFEKETPEKIYRELKTCKKIIILIYSN